MFDTLNPQQQAQLVDLAQRSFGNKKLGNAQRAKEALQNYPDFASRLAQSAGIKPQQVNPGNGDHDNSMREFSVDNAVYNSLRNGPQDDATTSPAADGSGKRSGGNVPMPRERPQMSTRDTAPSEGGRVARAEAENQVMNSRDGGFHRNGATPSQAATGGVPDGGAEAGLTAAGKTAAAGAAVAAGAYAASKFARGRGTRDTYSDPAETGDHIDPSGAGDGPKTGTDVARRGNTQPAQQSRIDSMIDGTFEEVPRTPQLEAPQSRLAYQPGADPRVAAGNTDAGGPSAPQEPQQLRGPSRASQYPTPMEGDGELASLAEVLGKLRGEPDASGVGRTLARKAPRIRMPGR